MLSEPGGGEGGRGTHPGGLRKASRRRWHLCWVLQNKRAQGTALSAPLKVRAAVDQDSKRAPLLP